ncbi:hypothetical protein EWM64_g9926 [Hericium alpestre]|uniref:Uncharacterized protein n=1 Tax=Hericium alpestre TaxID=135208 RepID=A0A4Y9ZH67_9AGAM|nr:hypothetical protein EWM64_g9926 [Hericium alpestre]
MPNKDTYDSLYRDPNYIVLKGSECFEKLCNFLDYGAEHIPLESYCYAASNWIISLYSAVCKPKDPSGAVGAHPQILFEDVDPAAMSVRAYKRRSPDLGAVISHVQEAKRLSKNYKRPVLLFWCEIKPMTKTRKAVLVPIRVSMTAHLPQVIEQAEYAMKHYTQQNVFYGFLMIGSSFSLWKFVRPSNYAESRLPGVPVSGKRPRTPSHDGLGEKAKLEAVTLYYCEQLIAEDHKNFSPQYLHAMALVNKDHGMEYQPSIFDPPPGDYSADPLTLTEAKDDIEEAERAARQAAIEADPPEEDDDNESPRNGRKRRKIKRDDLSFHVTVPNIMWAVSPARTRSRSASVRSFGAGPSISRNDDDDGDDDTNDLDNTNDNYDDDDDNDMEIGPVFVPIISDDEDDAGIFSGSMSPTPYDVLPGSEYDSEYDLEVRHSLLSTTTDASSTSASQHDGPLDSEYASEEELDDQSDDASSNPPPANNAS